jgi:integrase
MGTTYQLAVFVGLDERGRRRYRYETVHGSRRDAERRLAELVTAVGLGELGTHGATRFGELVDAWWEVSTTDLSPNTRIGYRGLLDRYLLPAFRNRRLDRIGPADLERLYALLLEGTAPGLARPLSAVTVYKVHSLARGVMATAVRWGWMPNNPASRAKAPRARVTPATVPSVEDVVRALDAASQIDEELHVFLWLSVALGTRRSETCALRWGDVDFDRGAIKVCRTLALDDRDPRRVVVKDTKTHAIADLPIDEQTVTLLRRFRAVHLQRSLAIGVTPATDAYLFAVDVDGGSPRHPDHFSKAWIRLRKPLGLEGVRVHDIRHFHGTELAAAGVPLTAIRDRLRHSNIRTTSIYAHSRREVDREAANAIGRLLPRLQQ